MIEENTNAYILPTKNGNSICEPNTLSSGPEHCNFNL